MEDAVMRVAQIADFIFSGLSRAVPVSSWRRSIDSDSKTTIHFMVGFEEFTITVAKDKATPAPEPLTASAEDIQCSIAKMHRKQTT
jgi:hypothetical protein